MEDGTVSLITDDIVVKVSSVLNRDSTYKKENMFDGSDESCWNSDQGTPQRVMIDFNRNVDIDEVHIMFQGGFVGKECTFLIADHETGKFGESKPFYPTDTNNIQTFPLQVECVRKVQLVFKSSTDFFGRVVIYKLNIFGKERDH